jgi:predicted N-formylglutamate amidohydrolase
LTVTPHEDADWPLPIVVVNGSGTSDIVLICEHASNHIPGEYEGLGLPASERVRHIAWDIGAEGVARSLAARLDAPCFLGTYSRLLIDLNRPVDSPTAIPRRSESTDIPGNLAMTAEERDRRIRRIFRPFHDHVASYLDSRDRQGRDTRIVAIHSFTPVFFGKTRPWHAGILFGRGRGFAETVIARLSEDPAMMIGANVPYVIDRSEDYAVPVHGDDRGYPAILVEIRQDLIATDRGIEAWADRLAAALA